MSEKKPTRLDGRSNLRKAFDTVERAVATRAEPIARSGGFAQAIGVYVSVNRGTRTLLGKATGGLLHLVNIPTVTDITKLHHHLTSVDSHIAELIRAREQTRPAATDEQADHPVANKSSTKPTRLTDVSKRQNRVKKTPSPRDPE